MKKFYLTIILILSLNSVSATELQGGVAFSVDSARNYVHEYQIDETSISGPYKFQSDNTEKVVYSYNNSGDIVGITVQYINEPKKAYIYDKQGILIYVDNYDKPTNIYPHRGYRYNLQGKLILSSLTVSKKEMFRFSPDGKLIAHSINGTIYDESGNVIGRGK